MAAALNEEKNLHKKSVALVTGANQNLGLQIAKDLVTYGFSVPVGSRNSGRGVVKPGNMHAFVLLLN